MISGRHRLGLLFIATGGPVGDKFSSQVLIHYAVGVVTRVYRIDFRWKGCISWAITPSARAA